MNRLTTTHDDIDYEIDEALRDDHPRTFIWTSMGNDLDARNELIERLEMCGLEVIDVLPPWHILACRSDVPIGLRKDMVKTFLDCMRSEEAAFRGKMFGYPKEHIDWYVKHLRSSVDKCEKYLSQKK